MFGVSAGRSGLSCFFVFVVVIVITNLLGLLAARLPDGPGLLSLMLNPKVRLKEFLSMSGG